MKAVGSATNSKHLSYQARVALNFKSDSIRRLIALTNSKLFKAFFTFSETIQGL